MDTAVASAKPVPPNSSGTVRPKIPNPPWFDPNLRKSGMLNDSDRLCARACGSTSRSAKDRTISRSAMWSSVGLKSLDRDGVVASSLVHDGDADANQDLWAERWSLVDDCLVNDKPLGAMRRSAVAIVKFQFQLCGCLPLP
mmetsp:Transcript_16923/g.35594  ORF Transcript_16923/g.35594 Transcript_16923/m.35594 type:complete len:141 (+) Transcript_16923:1374-1796(+)